jgi:DNA-nicking Smr family endonuclease
MSRAGRKPGGGGRVITPDEAELWKRATRALDRVKTKPRVGTAREQAPASTLAPAPLPPRTPAPASHRKPAAAAVSREKMAPPAPLAEFERRKVRQIASGKVEIGARVDLHGLRQQHAHARLRAFLLDAHAQGQRTVLVITGKGGVEPAGRLDHLAGERQRGVIRRNVPLWLEEPDLRAIVVSYTQAGPRHGGAGALYVQLRRGRRDPL